MWGEMILTPSKCSTSLDNGQLIKLRYRLKADQRRWGCLTGGRDALGVSLLQEDGSL